MHELSKLAQLEFSVLAKLFLKLAKLELERCSRKIEIAPVLLLGARFPSPIVSWLQLRNQGA